MTHPYTREYFDDGTIGYKGYRDFPSHWAIVKVIMEKQPESVLDVGGGRGYLVHKLEASGVRAVCMDISESAWHTRATDSFVLHDARIVPWKFKDKEFDLAISTSFMEHLTEPEIEVVIKEMARVSKRGYHTITYEKTSFDIDVTHRTFMSHEEWMKRFKTYAPDYPVEIMTKEQASKIVVDGSVQIELPPTDGLVKLNIGSFTDMFHHGWENWDIVDLAEWARQNAYIFRQVDVTKGIPKPDNSVDIILASHFIEHFTREEGEAFLKECHRVLKPDGLLRLAFPDARRICRQYLDGVIMENAKYNVSVEKASDEASALFELLLAGHKTIYDQMSVYDLLAKTAFTCVESKSFDRSNSTAIEKQTIGMYPTISTYVEAKKEAKSGSGQILSVEVGKTPLSDISTHVVAKNSVVHKREMRIALLSTPLLEVPPKNYGGLELIVANLGMELAKLGHEVTIFAPNGSKVEGCRVVEVGEAKNTVFTDWLRAETEMFEKIKDQLNDFDIIHGHNWFGMEYRAKVLNPKLHVLHTHHGGLMQDWWGKTKAPFKLNMVGISNWMKSVYERQGIPTRAVYNGVDLSKYPLKRKKGDRFLWMSRITFFKAPHKAIELAKKTGIKLDVAGATQFVEDAKYVEEIKKSCDGEQIRFIGEVSHEQKLELLQNAKALLVTGFWGEPFGLHVVEALSVGTQVLAVADGGIKETVKQGGALCQDLDALEDVIRHFKAISPMVCRKNAELFSAEAMAKSYVDAYADILQGKDW